MLTYPSQTAILQWIPFNLRQRFVEQTALLKGAHRRIPSRFIEVRISTLNRILEIDGFALDVELDDASGAIVAVRSLHLNGRLQYVPGHVTEMREGGVSRDTFICALLKWLDLSSHVIETLKIDAAIFTQKAFRTSALLAKTVHLVTEGHFSPEVASSLRFARHRHRLMESNSDLRSLVAKFKSQRPPIGVDFEFAVDFGVLHHQSSPWSQLEHLLCGRRQEGGRPEHGLLPINDAWLRAKETSCLLSVNRIEYANADMCPCLVFEMEHAALAVFQMSRREANVDGFAFRIEMSLVFRVVAKKSIPVLRPRGLEFFSEWTYTPFVMERSYVYSMPDVDHLIESLTATNRTNFKLMHRFLDRSILYQLPVSDGCFPSLGWH